MKKHPVFSVVTFFISFLSALGADAILGGNGRIRVPDAGIEMGITIYAEGWRGSYTSQSLRQQRFPDAKTGVAVWDARIPIKAGGGQAAHGTVTLTAGENGSARVRAHIVSDRDQNPEGVLWCVSLPASRFAGGKWSADEKHGETSADFNEKVSDYFSGSCKTFTITDKKGYSLTFTFPKPERVLLMDSRKWGDTLALRLYCNRVAFKKDRERTIDFTMSSPEGVCVKYAEPTIVKAGAEWIPVDYKKNIIAGSALDFSNQGLQAAPAGKYGWLKNVNGNFEFENKPGISQRFYGVNLCGTANAPDHAVADELVTRLVRLGYNTIRVHHHEKPILKNGAGGGLELDPVATDKMDYLIAKAIEAGLYVTTDIFVSRPVRWKDIGYTDRKEEIMPMDFYKALVAVDDRAFEDWCKWAKIFLGHKNPYTGRCYVDEPAMPLLSLINEGPITASWKRGVKDEPAIQQAYVKWLAKERAKNPGFAPKEPKDTSKFISYSKDGNMIAAFMSDVERRNATRLIAYLRALGSKALFTNLNCWPHSVALQEVRADLYDYVDSHFYIDHPRFIETSWALPSKIGNENPVLDEKLPVSGAGFVRLADKPYCITEWNFSGPGMYRGVGGIMTGAFSALQNWDGLWRFAYSHNKNSLTEGQCKPGYFDIGVDPLGQASDRASICLFLRRDLASYDKGIVLRVTEESKEGTKQTKGDNRELQVTPAWHDAAWKCAVATACSGTKVPPNLTEYPITENLNRQKNPPFVCETPKNFVLDREAGSFMISTPRTAGGFIPSGRLDCGAVSIMVKGAPATVWASSVDAEPTPITRAKRILVTHLTDVQADGNMYGDETKTLLLKWGEAPPVARAGSAEVRLAHESPDSLEVWALETNGARRIRVPSRVEDGKLVFTVAIAAPVAIFNYEVCTKQ